MDLTSRVAIVTGSARGIGQAIALKLAEVGANVVVNDIGEPEPLEKVAAEIRAMNRQSLAVIADVSSSTDAARSMRESASTVALCVQRVSLCWRQVARTATTVRMSSPARARPTAMMATRN